MELNGGQKEGGQKIVKWWKDPFKKQLFILTGFAGTGKTTIISYIVDELGIKDSTAFITFTGKAAMVMNLKGVPATTIHKLIYLLDPDQQDTEGKRKGSDSRLNFFLVDSLPPNIKLIVVDEASMLSKSILADLMSFGIPIILIGDPGQLPPIEDDPKILSTPDHHLSDIVRQQQDNPIIILSQDILEFGKIIPKSYGPEIGMFIGKKVPETSFQKADQVLCYKNSVRNDLNQKIRALNGFEGNLPVKGDKVICTRNNWQIFAGGYPLMNGCIGYSDSVGVCHDVSNDPWEEVDSSYIYAFDMRFRPDFSDNKTFLKVFKKPFVDCDLSFQQCSRDDKDLVQLDFGYAITAHKAQGSEFNNVIIYDDIPRRMLSDDIIRSWLYTAVTRAKQNLIYVR